MLITIKAAAKQRNSSSRPLCRRTLMLAVEELLALDAQRMSST